MYILQRIKNKNKSINVSTLISGGSSTYCLQYLTFISKKYLIFVWHVSKYIITTIS